MFSKNRTIGQRLTAMVLSLAMVLTMVGVPAKTVEAADASATESDLPTYDGKDQGIKIKLFNYTNKINHVIKSGVDVNKEGGLTADDYELRKIATYFNFRGDGAKGVAGTEEAKVAFDKMLANATYDVDGFTKNHATVERVLDGGFPVLDLSRHTTTDESGNTVAAKDPVLSKEVRSLAYLFSDKEEHEDHAVTAYNPNNTFLIKDNENPTHYYYNSKDNAVDYDITNNLFRVRNYTERTESTSGSAGGYCDYLPFNYTGGIKVGTNTTQNQDYHVAAADADYWFGTTMEVDFFQTKDGLIGEIPMEFSFSGDDDVWVFIDNVLVLDLGGTHGTVDGKINFSTGEVLQYLTWGGKNSTEEEQKYAQKTVTDENGNTTVTPSTTSFPTTLKACFEAAGKEPNGGWDESGDTFADYTKHTLKFFYLERGSSVANCKLDFDLQTLPENSLTVTKNLSTTENTSSEIKEFIEDSLSYKFRVLKAVGDVVTDELFIKEDTEYSIIENGKVTGTGKVGEDGYFTLKAGQSAQFEKMLEKGSGAKNYVVEEVMPTDLTGQYGGVEYAVDKEEGTVKENIEGAVADKFTGYQTDVLSAEKTQTVTYNNKVDTSKLGLLKITKEMAAGAAFSEGKKFDIQVELGDELLPVGTEYTVTGETTPRTVETAGIITLGIGETATLVQGILSGTKYEITEINRDGFNASYSGTVTIGSGETASVKDVTCDGDGASGEFPVAGTVHVTVTNANYDFSGNIPISKQALDNASSFTFNFVVEQVEKQSDGAYKTIEQLPGSSITVNDASKKEGSIVIGYQAGTSGTFYYKISEKQGEESFIYDKTYYIAEMRADGEKGEATLTGLWKNGNEATNEGAAAFVNQKTTSIKVTKTSDGVAKPDKTNYTFTASWDGGSETFTLKDGTSKRISGIPVGKEVTVTESEVAGMKTYCQIGNDTKVESLSGKVTAVNDVVKEIHFYNIGGYIEDDTVVIDYGLDVDVDVLSNDHFTGEVTPVLTQEVGTYGTAIVNANGDNKNKVHYTLNKDNGMQMGTYDEFQYNVSYNNGIEEGEQTYSANLAIVPATSIYYEDNFMTYMSYDWNDPEKPVKWTSGMTENENNVWSVVGETADSTQSEDRPGELLKEELSDAEVNKIYGYDEAYDEFATYSCGSAMKATVSSKTDESGKVTEGKFGTVEFTFTGTGFDVVSLTSNKTGTIVLTAKNQVTGKITSKIVDTYYGYKYEDGEWIVTKSDNNDLYQIPVLKMDGLDYGTYDVEITVSHMDLFDHEQYAVEEGTKKYDFYLDAIRVYNPADDGIIGSDENKDTTINDAYIDDHEGWPVYHELRNKLINAKDFNALLDATVNGAVYIDGKGTDVTIADYTNYGPNNEVYLTKNQAIAFKLEADCKNGENSIVDRIQLAYKLAQGSPKIKIYAVDSEYKIYNVKGEETTLEKITPVDVKTATDLYHDITALNGKTVVITNEGEGILSVTNIKVTHTAEHVKEEPSGTGEQPVILKMNRSSALMALRTLGLEEPEEKPEEKQGICVDEDGETRYYVDGVASYMGLVKDENGNYYYFNSTKKAVRNCTYGIGTTKANGLLPAGTYQFDAEGKMIDPPPTDREGLYRDKDGELRYYVNNVAMYAGVVQDAEGNYYYINSTKKAVRNCKYGIGAGKTNDLVPAGTYQFDAEGKMIR